jgi:hypothetical protein
MKVLENTKRFLVSYLYSAKKFNMVLVGIAVIFVIYLIFKYFFKFSEGATASAHRPVGCESDKSAFKIVGTKLPAKSVTNCSANCKTPSTATLMPNAYIAKNGTNYFSEKALSTGQVVQCQ